MTDDDSDAPLSFWHVKTVDGKFLRTESGKSVLSANSYAEANQLAKEYTERTGYYAAAVRI